MKTKQLSILLSLIILPFLLSCEPDDGPEDINSIGPEVITAPKHTLSSDEVIKEVQLFLKDINPLLTRSEQKIRVISSIWTKSLKSKNCLYFINFSDSLGYVIVSNDSRKGILGFSPSGNIRQDEIIDNPGLLITLSNLEDYASEPTRVDSIDHYEYGGSGDGYYDINIYSTTQGPLYPDPTMGYSSTASYDFHYSIGAITGIRP